MADVNSGDGTLTETDAVDLLMQGYAANEAEAEVEETEEEAEGIIEAEEVEDEASEVDDDLESDEGEDDDATEDADDADDDTAEEIDGEELNKGYLRQADYTRKTQELAAERATFEAEATALKAQAQQQLDQLKEAVATFAVQTEAEPNWSELAQTLDAKAYNAKRAEWDDKQAKMQQAKQIQESINQAEADQIRQAEAQKLLARIPEWNDATVAQSEMPELMAVAGEFGFTPDEVQASTDHRNLVLLRGMMLLRRQEKAAAKQKAKVRKKPKAPKAPVRENHKQKETRDLSARLRKTGSPDDAAALLLKRATG